jgi:hypothetical protein
MPTSPTRYPEPHPFSVLSEPILVAFCKGFAQVSLGYQQFSVQDAVLSREMNNHDRSAVMRAFITSHFTEALKGESQVNVRYTQNMYLIAIGRRILIHIKKLKAPQSPAFIPKTIEHAKHAPRQEPLPGIDEGDEIPLSNYEHYLVGGYTTDDLTGNIDAFYFRVQEAGEILDQFPLDLSLAESTVKIPINSAEQPSETKLKPKKDKRKGDQKAASQ